MSFAGYRDFLISNNVLTTAAGISFGQATLQLIKSFVADMLMPLIYMAFLGLGGMATKASVWRGSGGGKGKGKGKGKGEAGTAATAGFLTSVLVHKELRFANFIAEVITYVLILLTAYILITYVFRRYVGKAATSANTSAPAAPKDTGSAAAASVVV